MTYYSQSYLSDRARIVLQHVQSQRFYSFLLWLDGGGLRRHEATDWLPCTSTTQRACRLELSAETRQHDSSCVGGMLEDITNTRGDMVSYALVELAVGCRPLALPLLISSPRRSISQDRSIALVLPSVLIRPTFPCPSSEHRRLLLLPRSQVLTLFSQMKVIFDHRATIRWTSNGSIITSRLLSSRFSSSSISRAAIVQHTYKK